MALLAALSSHSEVMTLEGKGDDNDNDDVYTNDDKYSLGSDTPGG